MCLIHFTTAASLATCAGDTALCGINYGIVGAGLQYRGQLEALTSQPARHFHPISHIEYVSQQQVSAF